VRSRPSRRLARKDKSKQAAKPVWYTYTATPARENPVVREKVCEYLDLPVFEALLNTSWSIIEACNLTHGCELRLEETGYGPNDTYLLRRTGGRGTGTSKAIGKSFLTLTVNPPWLCLN